MRKNKEIVKILIDSLEKSGMSMSEYARRESILCVNSVLQKLYKPYKIRFYSDFVDCLVMRI